MKNINSVNIEKFKSVFVSIDFLTPMSAENMSRNALLACVMKKSNAVYKTEKEINRKLAKMYNAAVDIVPEKYKDYIDFRVLFEYINIEAINKEEIVNFLEDYIFNLNIQNDTFDEVIVQREKQGLLERINEEKDNKRKYALEELNKLMFEGEDYSCSIMGEPKIIEKLTGKELVSHYKYIMNNSKVILNVVGNLKGNEDVPNKIYNKIINKMPQNETLEIQTKLDEHKISVKIKEQHENQDISQSVIAIGAKAVGMSKSDMYKALVYNQILGGNPASLMFQNVREKNSLAYFAKSMYNRQRQSVCVFAGIEPKNYEKAKKLMLEQFEIMKNGEFSDIQFTASVDTLVATLNDIYDSKEELQKMLFTNEMYFEQEISIEEMINEILKVEKKDVIEFANKIYIDSIFCLEGGKHE